jgi:hypothetical protein
VSWACLVVVVIAVAGAAVGMYLMDRRDRRRGHRLRKSGDMSADVGLELTNVTGVPRRGDRFRFMKVFRGYEHSRDERYAYDAENPPEEPDQR